MPRVPSIAWLFVPLVFFGGDIASATQTLYIGNTASYANLKKVREKVREECAPEMLLPMVMREEILKRTPIQEAVPTSEPSAVKNGVVITFSILSLNIPPGAGWTTEKRSLKVKTVIYRNGSMVDEYVRYAATQGGGNLVNRGTCQIVERLVRIVSVHTAEWLTTINLFQEVPPSVGRKEANRQ